MLRQEASIAGLQLMVARATGNTTLKLDDLLPYARDDAEPMEDTVENLMKLMRPAERAHG